MNESLRQKKVARIVKEILSAQLITLFQDSDSGLVTVTRLEMSKDLKTAHVHVSVFGDADEEAVLQRLQHLQGSLRKSVASHSKLKYNPKLIFSLDPLMGHEKRIDQLLNGISNDEH
ncbi:MAG: 30S ribosome-binding factor RbfA [Candidatus Aminicenantaceae bacterium]